MTAPDHLNVGKRPVLFAVWSALVLYLFVVAGAFAELAARAPIDLMGSVADDAFYYFQIAENVHTHGIVSFDGTTPTTGFHYLYLVLLLAIRPFVTSPDAFVVAGIGIGAIGYAIGVSIFYALLVAEGRIRAALGLLALLLVSGLHAYALIGLETGLVVMSLGAYLAILRWALGRPREITISAFVALLLASLACVTSRSDTALVLAPLLLVPFLAPVRKPGVALLQTAALGLASICVVGITYSITAMPSQDSGAVKMALRRFADLRGEPYWSLSAFDHLLLVGLDGLLPLSMLAVAAVWLAFRADRCSSFVSRTIPGLCASYAGLAFAYDRLLVDVQVWSLVIPTLIVTFLVAFTLDELINQLPNVRRPKRLEAVGWGLVLLVMAQWQLDKPALEQWPYQRSMREQALQLESMMRQDGATGRVGSWNSGILGYYSGARVVNLDGLANVEIRRAIETGRPGSVREVAARLGVTHIFDWSFAFESRRQDWYWGHGFLFHQLETVSSAEVSPAWGPEPRFRLARIKLHREGGSRDESSDPQIGAGNPEDRLVGIVE